MYVFMNRNFALLVITFVFAQWWAFENVFVPRDQTLNEDINL